MDKKLKRMKDKVNRIGRVLDKNKRQLFPLRVITNGYEQTIEARDAGGKIYWLLKSN